MLVTTRFNEETWTQNCHFRERHPEFACIYGPSRRMPERIPLRTPVFVFEMNNTRNRIEGIGLIRNQLFLDKSYRIYEKGKFNCYLYTGEYRLDRRQLDESFLRVWDTLLFRQKTHLKRGVGFTCIPTSFYQHPLCAEWGGSEKNMQVYIGSLFKEAFGQKDLNNLSVHFIIPDDTKKECECH
jgi:hypothetical protein